MKASLSAKIGLSVGTLIAMSAIAHASPRQKYILTITNGGNMPLSPSAIYVKNGEAPETRIGGAPTAGFVQLCTSGDPSLRMQELKKMPQVTSITGTNGLIMPGESRSVEVSVMNPRRQSIHLETMYGKSKDICAVASIGHGVLVALKNHKVMEVAQRDSVVQTGAFLDPAVPRAMEDQASSMACESAADGVSCLRELSAANPEPAKVRFHSTYLPSVLQLIESKFGASDAQSLVISPAGGVRVELRLKH